MDTLRQDLRILRQRLGQNPCPLDHVRPDMTLGLFIVESDIEDCSLGELIGSAETALDRLPRTYTGLAARLARAAEEAEQIHGLPPLK